MMSGSCRECQASLRGDSWELRSEMLEHLANCADCAYEWVAQGVVRNAAMVPTKPLPEPAVLFTRARFRASAELVTTSMRFVRRVNWLALSSGLAGWCYAVYLGFTWR